MWNLEKWDIWTYLQTRSYRHRYRELMYGYQGETGSGGRNWEIGIDVYTLLMGFPGGPSGKEAASQFRRPTALRFNPWVGKSPLEKRTQPTAVFLSGKSHDRGAWRGTVCAVAKELTRLSTHYWYYVLIRQLMRTDCVAQGTLLRVLWWYKWEGNPKKKRYI